MKFGSKTAKIAVKIAVIDQSIRKKLIFRYIEVKTTLISPQTKVIDQTTGKFPVSSEQTIKTAEMDLKIIPFTPVTIKCANNGKRALIVSGTFKLNAAQHLKPRHHQKSGSLLSNLGVLQYGTIFK